MVKIIIFYIIDNNLNVVIKYDYISNIQPPFNEESAKAKVKAAQDAWNTRNPRLVAQAYTIDSQWRNRIEFFSGRTAIMAFLKRK